MVCGHEIGHASLHRPLAKEKTPCRNLCFSICAPSMNTKRTLLPHAHLIIDDDELIDNLEQGYDVVQLSTIMGTNINLMLIKLNEMNRMGWRLNLPYVPHSDFLRKIRPE